MGMLELRQIKVQLQRGEPNIKEYGILMRHQEQLKIQHQMEMIQQAYRLHHMEQRERLEVVLIFQVVQIILLQVQTMFLQD